MKHIISQYQLDQMIQVFKKRVAQVGSLTKDDLLKPLPRWDTTFRTILDNLEEALKQRLPSQGSYSDKELRRVCKKLSELHDIILDYFQIDAQNEHPQDAFKKEAEIMLAIITERSVAHSKQDVRRLQMLDLCLNHCFPKKDDTLFLGGIDLTFFFDWISGATLSELSVQHGTSRSRINKKIRTVLEKLPHYFTQELPLVLKNHQLFHSQEQDDTLQRLTLALLEERKSGVIHSQQVMQYLYDIPTSELPLDTRWRNALKTYFPTLGDVLNTPIDALNSLKGIGKKFRIEFQLFLQEYHLEQTTT